MGGGTEIEITGEGFSMSENSVTVDGLPCDVISSSLNSIKCITREKTPINPQRPMGVEHLVFTNTRRTSNLETDYPLLENYLSKNVTLSMYSHNSHKYYIKPNSYPQVSVRRGYLTPPESGEYRFIWNSDESTAFYFGVSEGVKELVFDEERGYLEERNLLGVDRIYSQWYMLESGIGYYIELRNEERGSYANVGLELKYSSSHPLNPRPAQKVKIDGNLLYEYHNFSILDPPLDLTAYYKWIIYLNDINGNPLKGKLSNKIYSRCKDYQFKDSIKSTLPNLSIKVHVTYKDKEGADYTPSNSKTDENIGEIIYHVKIIDPHYTQISFLSQDRKPESVGGGVVTRGQLKHNSDYLFDLGLEGEFSLSLEHPGAGGYDIRAYIYIGLVKHCN